MDSKALFVIISIVALISAGCAAVFILNDSGGGTETVTFETGEGYEFSERTQKVSSGYGITFTVTILEGYTKTDEFAVKCNDSILEPRSGRYSINNITSDCTVTVIGVEKVAGTTYSFYLSDNFSNENWSNDNVMYPFPPTTGVRGVWIKAISDNVVDAFGAALKKMGYDCVINDGNLESVSYTAGGSTFTIDSNLYVWQWDETLSEWKDKNANERFLTLGETTGSYIAIVHGASTLPDRNGNAPAVNTTPSEITWYYGDRIEHNPGKCVTFYVGNSFEFSEFENPVPRSDNSDPLTLLVPGLWIKGYAAQGSGLVDALTDALDSVGWTYNVGSDGWISSINDINDQNFSQASWVNGAWDYEKWLGVTTVDEIDYFVIVHGEWQDGSVTPPDPKVTPADIVWAH